MSVFSFLMGTPTSTPQPDGWSAGLLWLWGKEASSPDGTRFHFRVIPMSLPASLLSSGKTLEIEWLRPGLGEGGGDMQVFATGWDSPALEIRLGNNGGGDPPPPPSYSAHTYGEQQGGQPWETTLFNGVPEPPDGSGWDWAIGAMLRIKYPFDWVSPAPYTDRFTFKVELWSSREEPNPWDPANPLMVPDSFLYTLADTGEGRMDHPVIYISPNASNTKWLCPGMMGATVRLQADVPRIWVQDPMLP